MNKKRRQTRQRPCREGGADEFQDAVLYPQARAAGAADHHTDIYMLDDSVQGFFSNPLGYKYFMHCTIAK